MMKPLFDRMSEGEGRLNKRSTAGIEREKKSKRKEERVKTIHDKDKRRSFTEKGDAWKRLKEKMMESTSF